MRLIFVVIDGLGDRHSKKFKKTPLEKAETESLDFLSLVGANGRLFTVGKNIAPESDSATIALLGFDPLKYSTGRGIVEAVGIGMKKEKGIYFRANFATVKGKFVDRRVGRTLSSKESFALEKEINSKVRLSVPFKFKHSIEHRGILFLKGNLSSNVSNTDPAYKKKKNIAVASNSNVLKKCIALDSSSISKKTASIVNSFSIQAAKILSSSKTNYFRMKKKLLPANYIFLRDASSELPKLKKKKNWIAVVGMPLEKGLARLCGMKLFPVSYKTNSTLFESLYSEANSALKAIRSFPNSNVLIHFKAVDVAGHDGDFVLKKELIEFLEDSFFISLLSLLDFSKDRVVVTADHSTPCVLKRHSSDFVPFVVAGFNVFPDSVSMFSEYNKGSLGIVKGANLLSLALKTRL